MKKTPLCVDLDGTLLKGDSTYRVFKEVVFKSPLKFFGFLPNLLFNRGALKEVLRAQLAVKLSWEFYPDVVEYLKLEKESGRRLYLATGCDQIMAHEIVKDLDLFDGVFGSSDGVNFISAKKAELLIEKFGEGQFDYIGNSSQDLAVWAKARYALVANADEGLLEKAKKIAEVVKVF